MERSLRTQARVGQPSPASQRCEVTFPPQLEHMQTRPQKSPGGVLVLANEHRNSPRPCKKFRTKHNSNRFLPPTKPYFGFGFERYFSADDQWATGACRAGPNKSTERGRDRPTLALLLQPRIQRGFF